MFIEFLRIALPYPNMYAIYVFVSVHGIRKFLKSGNTIISQIDDLEGGVKVEKKPSSRGISSSAAKYLGSKISKARKLTYRFTYPQTSRII